MTSYCIVCQVMQENMLLVKEINMQRGHNKAAKRVLEAQVTCKHAHIWNGIHDYFIDK